MDAYQQAVEYLTANPGEIYHAWSSPATANGGCLFKYATPSGRIAFYPGCECLTGIRNQNGSAYTDDATAAIRGDARIPLSGFTEGDVDALPAAAQWQRWLDKRYNRTPPELDPRIPLPTKEVEFELPETLIVEKGA